MQNRTGGFRHRLFFWTVLGFLVSGCTLVPEPVTVTPIAFTPVNVPTQDAAQGPSKPFWELTTTPDPYRATAVVELAQTAFPDAAVPTQEPGEELSVYLPILEELPQCLSLDYVVQLTSARAVCSLIPQGSLSITVFAADKAYAESSLSLPTGYKEVAHDPIGQASIAGTSERGDTVTITLFKKQMRVFLSYTTPRMPVDPLQVLAIARRMERKLPESSPPPLALSFPEEPRLEKKADYFSAIQVSLITNGRYHFSSEFNKGDRICVYVAPLRTDYDQLWTIVLYDLQTEQVVKKMLRGMYAQNVCSGLEPDYPQGTYKAGDRYELRIAVKDEWIATFPLETQ